MAHYRRRGDIHRRLGGLGAERGERMKIYYEEIPDNYVGDYPSVTIHYRKSESAEAETIALYLGDTQNPFAKARRERGENDKDKRMPVL